MEAKCTIYPRVSTKEQTAENQLPQLLQLAESGGYEVAEIYQKNKSAWRAGHQRELTRLLADCRDGMCEYDAVLLWALDSLTREGIAKILEWVNIFKGVGVKVVSLNESWTDTTTPHGKFIFNIMAAVAALERQTVSQQIQAGMDYAKQHGTRLGNKIGRKRYDVPFAIVCKALQACCGNYSAAARWIFEETGIKVSPGFVQTRVQREDKMLEDVLGQSLQSLAPKSRQKWLAKGG